MALKTQGTHLYLIDPDAVGGPDVLTIGCVTAVNGIEATREQLETTCLDSPARTYEAGLATPGQMTFTINFDPADESHVRIYELWKAGTKFEMALGYSDGTAVPTVDTNGMFDLPPTRSYLVFHDTYIANVPQDLALNALVTANVAVQLSGFPDLFKKA
ncbi:hypothetical protein GCM10027347_59020 [Larkinella harenae]